VIIAPIEKTVTGLKVMTTATRKTPKSWSSIEESNQSGPNEELDEVETTAK